MLTIIIFVAVLVVAIIVLIVALINSKSNDFYAYIEQSYTTQSNENISTEQELHENTSTEQVLPRTSESIEIVNISNNGIIKIETVEISDNKFGEFDWLKVNDEDNGLVIHGKLRYTRELTDEERSNFSHGGEIYYEYGPRDEGLADAIFWSDADEYAVMLPEKIEPGVYEYYLHLFFGDEHEESVITFTVK